MRHRRLLDAISIHALHEESDVRHHQQPAHHIISIHALHEESDVVYGFATKLLNGISIHALHEESDFPFDGF